MIYLSIIMEDKMTIIIIINKEEVSVNFQRIYIFFSSFLFRLFEIIIFNTVGKVCKMDPYIVPPPPPPPSFL